MGNAVNIETFEDAVSREGALNERQWEVLRLLAAGKTNPEMAEKLGMTLDGAKWNVSEILSKLGLSGREEAAAYYHWRRRPAVRLRRAVSGLAGLLSTKWLLAGGAGAVVVVATVAGLFALGKDGSREANGQQPFYLEARFRGESGGTDPVGGSSTATVGRLQWWWQSPDRFRWETQDGSAFRVGVADGTNYRVYDSQLRSIDTEPLPAGPLAAPQFVPIGPQPYASVDDFVRMLQTRSAAPVTKVEMLGHETLLGRDTLVLEYSPAWVDVDGRPIGSGKVWIDADGVAVLKLHMDLGDGNSLDGEVTTYSTNVTHPADRFHFDPPPGTSDLPNRGRPTLFPDGVEVRQIGPAGVVHVPEWALTPDWLPDGLRVDGDEPRFLDGTPAGHVAILRDAGPRVLFIDQERIGEGHARELGGKAVTVGEATGFFEVGPELLTLAWVDADVAITIRARGLTEEDILRIAREMRRGP